MKAKKLFPDLSIKRLLNNQTKNNEKISNLNKNIEEISAKINSEPVLLLETTSVTTSVTSFPLSESWKNYRKIHIVTQYNYSNTNNIGYGVITLYTSIIQTDGNYYDASRQVGSGTATSEAAMRIYFSNDDTKIVKLVKIASSYNARKIWVYGIK